MGGEDKNNTHEIVSEIVSEDVPMVIVPRMNVNEGVYERTRYRRRLAPSAESTDRGEQGERGMRQR